MRNYAFFWGPLAAILIASCSPLKTSPHDEKHQLELTLHEVQTNLDDLRHSVSCFQTEMQILDGRIRYYENTLLSLKAQDLQGALDKISQLGQQIHLLEKKLGSYEKTKLAEEQNLEKLASHAEQTSLALAQFKNRLHEIEKEAASVARIRDHLESLAHHLGGSTSSFKIYKVSPGDSLEKIAKAHKTTVQKLKECNQLDQEDLIVIGRELKIPTG